MCPHTTIKQVWYDKRGKALAYSRHKWAQTSGIFFRDTVHVEVLHFFVCALCLMYVVSSVRVRACVRACVRVRVGVGMVCACACIARMGGGRGNIMNRFKFV
jgi:hypothetical protein